MQPRIVAQAPLAQVRLDPLRGGLVGDVTRLKKSGIDLGAGLKRIAPVDENSGLFGQDDGQAGGPGSPRQPLEPPGVGRHPFGLVFVLNGNDETGQATGLQLAAQGRQPLCRGCRVGAARPRIHGRIMHGARQKAIGPGTSSICVCRNAGVRNCGP